MGTNLKKVVEKMKEKIRLIIFWMVVITLTACKTKQTIIPVMVTDSIPPSKTGTIAAESDSLKVPKLDYHWLSYRANAAVSTPGQNNSVNVYVVNRKDSIIYINASKFGIEGARLVLTPDSVKFLNHFASNYYVGNYTLLEQLIGFKVNFYMLQSLLVGEELPENTKSFMQASYGNFTTINSQPFFQQADFVIPKENIQINIQIKSIKLNEAGPTSIRIPEKYTPIMD